MPKFIRYKNISRIFLYNYDYYLLKIPCIQYNHVKILIVTALICTSLYTVKPKSTIVCAVCKFSPTKNVIVSDPLPCTLMHIIMFELLVL